jgi:hypothetical protein
MMYMHERDARPVPAPLTAVAVAALAISVIGILYLGILPTQIMQLAGDSVSTIQ